MSNDQEQLLGMALALQSDAICTYLEFERHYFDGTWTREMLQTAADERGVYYDDRMSDYELFAGCLASMRVDLLNINSIIRAKIKVQE